VFCVICNFVCSLVSVINDDDDDDDDDDGDDDNNNSSIHYRFILRHVCIYWLNNPLRILRDKHKTGFSR